LVSRQAPQLEASEAETVNPNGILDGSLGGCFD
jgi:hypothetical protein